MQQQNKALFALAALALVACVAALPAGKINQRIGASSSPLVSIKGQQQLGKGNANQVSPVFASRPLASPVVQVQQQEQEPEADTQVQQQQEIEPTGAAQGSAPAIIAPVIAAPAEEVEPRPEPYSFNYAFESGDSTTSGSSQRAEQQTAAGVVTGFYTLRGEDGRDRRVDYTADASGFRAVISTNELGTAAKNSADVEWQAQEPTDGQLRAAESATQAARQRQANAAPAASSISWQTQQQQQQQPLGSASSSSLASLQRLPVSKVRVQPARENFASASKTSSSQQQVQLQEPFEQIRQTELRTARKSRQAPFYLFSI